MTTITLDPIFERPWLLIVMAMVILAVPWIVPVAARSVDRRQQRTLQLLRTATSLLLLMAVLRPAIVRTDSLPTDATLAVLLDRSRSMTLPVDDKHTRSDIQNQIYAELLPAIGQLDDSLDLKTLAYAAETREIPTDEAGLRMLDSPPEGRATDMTRALAAAIQSASGRPLAGVVLIGDGVEVLPAKTADEPAVRDNQAGARLLASLDVPLWTIAIGPPGDLDQVRDVEVSELAESFSLFAGNESEVDFVIRTRALAGKSLPVVVSMTPEHESGAAVEVAVRTVTPTGAEETIPMSIPIVAPREGRYRMEVRVRGQEGETLTSNNSQVAFVDVRKGGGRVLYIEGQPRPEQHFLLRSLRRFPDLQVAYRWIASDTKNRWPIDLGLDQPSNRYDIIILGDLPAAALGTAQLSAVAKRIGEGASLLMIGGVDTFAQGGYGESPLAAVIPVKLDSRLKDFAGEIVPVVPESHPIIELVPDADLTSQATAWSELPPFVGANRFADVRVAPGIEILLETPDGDPLFVVGEYGAGRVATFAGDHTWRWWRQGNSLEHRRFWRQTMLWLLNRDTDSTDSIDIALDRRRGDLNQPINYTIRYPRQTSASEQAVSIAVIAADGASTSVSPGLTSTENEVELLQGELKGLRPGMYQLKATLAGDGRSAAKSFQIVDQDAELRQPFADHTYLAQLASQTTSSGGAMFLPEDVGELIDLISQLRRHSQAPVLQKYRLVDSPWSAWPLFIALTTLLGAEWYLRRRWGLA
ncbi:MAG: glutamine amidotransferase [Planctomycetaceae bacterium]